VLIADLETETSDRLEERTRSPLDLEKCIKRKKKERKKKTTIGSYQHVVHSRKIQRTENIHPEVRSSEVG